MKNANVPFLFAVPIPSASVCVSSSSVVTAAWFAINTLMLLWLYLALGFSAMEAKFEVGHPQEDCCCHGTWRDRDRKKLKGKTLECKVSVMIHIIAVPIHLVWQFSSTSYNSEKDSGFLFTSLKCDLRLTWSYPLGRPENPVFISNKK